MEVCILNTHDIFEANLVQAKLENYGIHCDLRTNDAGGMIPHLRIMQGIQIYISKKDVEKAQEILSADHMRSLATIAHKRLKK